jgi:uncharacterized protein
LPPLKIAVVGSGISGLSAAWLLSQRHEVSLFEAADRLGGHSNTVTVTEKGQAIPIDTGFIVYNTAAYPNLVALFDHLKVPTTATEMGFGVSLDQGRYEYAGRGFSQIIGGIGNLADPGHWRMLADVARFFRTARQQAEGLSDEVTLGEFLRQQGYSQDFTTRHLLPMAAAIWSAAPGQMAEYPVRSFLRFFDNHGLLKFRNRPKWRTVTGGSREYVSRLVAASRLRVLTGHPVTRIERGASGARIYTKSGDGGHFDHVVIAAHADEALAMLAHPTSAETCLLSAFAYSDNLAVLHRDARLMPRRRRLWSSWNYIGDREVSGCAVSYWMNALQPLATSTDYFVTLNPHHEPAPETVVGRFAYKHPVFSPAALRAQRQLWSLQGEQRTWFCGAHFGSGFHEDGLQAGLAVAEQLGGLSRPWTVANPSTRIFTDAGKATARPAVLEAA